MKIKYNQDEIPIMILNRNETRKLEKALTMLDDLPFNWLVDKTKQALNELLDTEARDQLVMYGIINWSLANISPNPKRIK